MASKARQSVLADGTQVDQEYYQSKNYILEQLQAKRQVGSTTEAKEDLRPSETQTSEEKTAKTTDSMLKSGAVSKDDGWLLASMETPLRNPFCVANHPADQQIQYYTKVLGISFAFMFMVAISTMCWAWWWKELMLSGTKPIMPCKGIGVNVTVGRVYICNSTDWDGNTNQAQESDGLNDGCDESAPLSICVEDTCIVDPNGDEIRSCWSMAAFMGVICCTYMLLLFRRDQAGKGLLSCACFVEGILGGAGTLHYDSSIFVELFSYLSFSVLGALIYMNIMYKKKFAAEWSTLKCQIGSHKSSVPEVQTRVNALVKQSLIVGAAVVTFIAIIWHVGGARLTGGSDLAFILSLLCLAVSIAWILREIGWTQLKYDPEQYINMCISFHVDLYCLFILFCIFFVFAVNDSCHQGPINCGPWFCSMMAHQCERCTRFGCGCNKSATPDAQKDEVAASKGGESGQKSVYVEKEIETEEQWKKKKMINAACGCGVLMLGALSFFIPMVTFFVSVALCVFLPFFRAYTDKPEEEDTSNV